MKEEVEALKGEEQRESSLASKESVKDRSRKDSVNGSQKSSIKSDSKGSSILIEKDLSKESLTSHSRESLVGLLKESIVQDIKEEDMKQRAVTKSPLKTVAKYKAEDQVAAEKLLKTTYKETAENSKASIVSKEGSVTMVVPKVLVEGRRHRLDSQGDSRQGEKLPCSTPPRL